MYRLIVEPQARRAMARLPARDRGRLVIAIDALADDPRPVGCMPVSGARQKGTYRIRVGNYRVIYVVRDEEQVVIVAHVGHRKDVYRDLN